MAVMLLLTLVQKTYFAVVKKLVGALRALRAVNKKLAKRKFKFDAYRWIVRTVEKFKI